MTNPEYFDKIKDSPKDTQVGGDHYKLPIQPITYVLENNLGFIEGNIIKYISRYNRKHKEKSKMLEDLRKCEHYIQLLIEKIDKS